MEGIQGCTPACRPATSAPPIQFQGEGAQLTCLNVSEDRSADISIVTAEGDKVTLSSDQHFDATLLTYQHMAYSNSGYEAEEGQLIDLNDERNVSMFVEGDLNDQELADIQALLSDLGQVLKAFLTGRGEGGADEDAGDLSRYDSLSAFEAGFEYHADVQYMVVQVDQLAVQVAGKPSEAMPAVPPAASIAPAGVEAPQPAAPEVAAAVSTPDPLPAAAAPFEATPETVAPQIDRAAREMAEKVKESGLKPRRWMKLFKKFLRGLMKEMRANRVIDDEQAKHGESILEKFLGQLEKPTGASEAQATAVSVKQQWVSLQYELKADFQMQPSVEETV